MQQKGSYQVEAKCVVNDYRINLKGKSKTCHINLLKKQAEKDNVGDKDLVEAVNRGTYLVGGAVLERVCSAIIENNESCSSYDAIKGIELLDVIAL